jgi:DNA-binding MarR family transcriptional regulator
MVSMETISGNTLQTHLGYWLRLVSNQVSGRFARALQERELSVAEWVALNQIGGGSAVSPADIATATGMTRGAISKVLDKLEHRKWLTRAVREQDHRAQLLTLTRPARRVLPELIGIADRNEAHFFGVLTTAEQSVLRTLLQKVAASHQLSTVPVD